MTVDELNPEDMCDMLKWMIHIYHIIRASGDDALRYYWLLVIDVRRSNLHPCTENNLLCTGRYTCFG